jgi:DNA-binding transcriptional MerR regulator
MPMGTDVQPSPAEAVARTGRLPDAGEGGENVFTIAQLAHEFGVTLRTLRHYEGLGLLSPRRTGAARLYSQSDHDRVAQIVQGKKLGFTLREIRELLATPEGDGDRPLLRLSRAQCVEQINLLERRKRAIEHALSELRRTYSSYYTSALARERPEG